MSSEPTDLDPRSLPDAAPKDATGDLVEAYLDDQLGPEEVARLGRLVAERPDVADRLARAMLVHDRLSALLRAPDARAVPSHPVQGRHAADGPWGRRVGRIVPAVAAVVLAALLPLVLLRTRPADASAALEQVVRAAVAGDRVYRIRVADHGPGGDPGPVKSEAGGRKPGADGARLYVRGADAFVLVRTFADGTEFVDGCDGSIGWSVPPTGHVHLSRDLRRFRRGIPGERDDLPFIVLGDALRGLREGFDARLDAVPDSEGLRRLEIVRRRPSRSGPQRATIRFTDEGVARRIEIEGSPRNSEGPVRVALELESSAPLPADFFDHGRHHAADRPLDWE